MLARYTGNATDPWKRLGDSRDGRQSCDLSGHRTRSCASHAPLRDAWSERSRSRCDAARRRRRLTGQAKLIPAAIGAARNDCLIAGFPALREFMTLSALISDGFAVAGRGVDLR
jgi:hypothetical protein